MSFSIISGENFQPASSNFSERVAPSHDVPAQVSKIIAQVRHSGDLALHEYTQTFDGVDSAHLRVPAERIRAALQRLDPTLRHTFELAIERIGRFHQRDTLSSWEETDQTGCTLGQQVMPIDRVGIYIPGGQAVYPSSLLMNAIPAQVAGVPSIAVVSPPQKSSAAGGGGEPHELILATCALLGLDEVYAVGGAQAIAALAYGTESIPAVCKITGPGNAYVAEAKRQVFGEVGIDSVAGPSEVMILHDDPSVPVDYLLRDLLAQAEHDENASAVLLTTCVETAHSLVARAAEVIPGLPRRNIIEAAVGNNGKIVLLESLDQGIKIINRCAPEHLELMTTDPDIVAKIRNAGAIFVGTWSTEALGDYLAGPNHTIPTGASARYASPLTTRDFQKLSSVLHYSKEAFLQQAPAAIRFAEAEGLYSHAASLRVRLED